MKPTEIDGGADENRLEPTVMKPTEFDEKAT
jgi:hypothetical protein